MRRYSYAWQWNNKMGGRKGKTATLGKVNLGKARGGRVGQNRTRDD